MREPHLSTNLYFRATCRRWCMFWIARLLVVFFCVEPGSTAVVTSVSELISKMRDSSVDRIFMGPGVFQLGSLSTLANGVLTIGPNRKVDIVGNLTVVEANSTNSFGAQGAKTFRYASGIDFGANSAGIFRLADNTSLGFFDVILVHGLSQLGYDWQVVALQQPSARAQVVFNRTIKLRDGCLPLQIFQQHVTSYVRLPGITGNQSASVRSACYDVPQALRTILQSSDSVTINNVDSLNNNTICIPEVLGIDDLATFISRSNEVSYRLYEQGSTYWCRAYASMACLSARGPEECVQELLAATYTRPSPQLQSATSSAASTGSKENTSMGIVLPAVLTGVLVIFFVSATVYCLRRRSSNKRGSSSGALPDGNGDANDLERVGGAGGRRGPVGRVELALAWLLPTGTQRTAQTRSPDVPGYVPVVSKEAFDCIAKVRAELSIKMVVASSDDDLSDVRNLQLVGKGTFGRVFKGEWKGVTVALKVISVPVSQYGQAQWQHVMGEAAISTLLNHPCVLQTYSVALLEYTPTRKAPSVVSEDGEGNLANKVEVGNDNLAQVPAPVGGAVLGEIPQFYQLKMVSEFCDGGSVVHALHCMRFYESAGGAAVRLPAIIDIASQVASGMAYLHSANIIHADLKAANVLLKQQPGCGRLQAKVADFGLSFRMDEPEATHVTKGQLGSITHMAPEVLVQGRISKSSDVYSFGILLYELYTGQPAYVDIPQSMLAYHVATAGGRPHLSQHCPPAFRDLAKSCWSHEASARPTFLQVYQSLQTMSERFRRQVGTQATEGIRNSLIGVPAVTPAGRPEAAPRSTIQPDPTFSDIAPSSPVFGDLQSHLEDGVRAPQPSRDVELTAAEAALSTGPAGGV